MLFHNTDFWTTSKSLLKSLSSSLMLSAPIITCYCLTSHFVLLASLILFQLLPAWLAMYRKVLPQLTSKTATLFTSFLKALILIPLTFQTQLWYTWIKTESWDKIFNNKTNSQLTLWIPEIILKTELPPTLQSALLFSYYWHKKDA